MNHAIRKKSGFYDTARTRLAKVENIPKPSEVIGLLMDIYLSPVSGNSVRNLSAEKDQSGVVQEVAGRLGDWGTYGSRNESSKRFLLYRWCNDTDIPTDPEARDLISALDITAKRIQERRADSDPTISTPARMLFGDNPVDYGSMLRDSCFKKRIGVSLTELFKAPVLFPQIFIDLQAGLGMSKRQLRRDLKVAPFTYMQIEAGKMRLAPDKLERALQIFSLPEEYAAQVQEAWSGFDEKATYSTQAAIRQNKPVGVRNGKS